MATTTNFGWETPDDTDLVKDGAAAIRTSLNGVDTSFVDLKGGTTGQLLSKNSNTDLDYTWVAPSTGDITGVTAGTGISGGGTAGDVTVTNSMATAIDAKGDLIAGTGADAFSRLAVGTNNQVLTADSAQATGMKWASPASGLTKISTTTLSSSYADISNIFSATYDRYLIVMEITAASDSIMFQMQSSGTRDATNYGGAVSGYRYNATAHNFSKTASGDGYLLNLGTATSPGVNGLVHAVISSPFAAANTRITGTFTGVWNAGSFWTSGSFGMTHSVASSFNGISILPVSGNMTGTFTVYGIS
jgi:hypothetical protein